jgi:D-glycero-beta-D-manno-heptose-7-phosphate kinase
MHERTASSPNSKAAAPRRKFPRARRCKTHSMKINSKERSALIGLIGQFPLQHVVVLGDLVADEFVYGEIARVSREAPVLILKQREKQIVPGGGANAANNLADLGARVTMVGAVGNDEAGKALLRYFQQRGISTRRVARLRGYSTPTKSRILGGLTHWQRQQIVRVDREPPELLRRDLRRRLSASAAPLVRLASALLISDYGYGATDAREVEFLRRRAGRKPLPITVDSRYGLLSYSRVTASTPNEPEIETAFGRRIGNDLDLLYRLGRRTLRRMSLEALVVTRGRDGMVLFEPNRKPQHLSIFGSDQVADVTGAGDTVIAAFTLALAAGASFYQAAQLANCAGGLVVMKRGTATVTARELEEALRTT